MAVNAELVKQLREQSGAGILDCKKALDETGGDLAKAAELLRQRNQAVAAKKQSREAKDGKVASYIHGDGRIGVLVEVNSETDFVARSDMFAEFVKEVCLQIAAMNPKFVSRDDVAPEELERLREAFKAEALAAGKPPQVAEKIVEGKLAKWCADSCLLDQTYIRDETRKVKDLLTEVIGRCGENVKVSRFVRYALGGAS